MKTRHRLLIVLSAISISQVILPPIYADPDAGMGNVQYTLPAARTTTGMAENFTARKAKGNWMEVCDSCDPTNFDGSPFNFTLGFMGDSMKISAETDGARAQVLDKVGGATYKFMQQLDPPYPGPH